MDDDVEGRMTARTVRRVRAIDVDDDAGDARARVRGDVVVDGVSRDGARGDRETETRGRVEGDAGRRGRERPRRHGRGDRSHARGEERGGGGEDCRRERVDVRPEDVDAVRVSKRHRGGKRREDANHGTRGRVHETGRGHGGEDGEHDGGGERELANRGRRGGGSVER